MTKLHKYNINNKLRNLKFKNDMYNMSCNDCKTFHTCNWISL